MKQSSFASASKDEGIQLRLSKQESWIASLRSQ
jgi:hypothetical protein